MTDHAQPRLLPIQALNALDSDAFATAVRPLFEAAEPLAQALYAHRPYASYTQLLARAEWLVQTLPLAQQLQVANAHPRIGESAERLSTQSSREQLSPAEASLPPAERAQLYAQLADLNRLYEERFGFRFVVFVNGRPKAAILEILRQRLTNEPAAELRTALQELFLIARDRCRLLGPTR